MEAFEGVVRANTGPLQRSVLKDPGARRRAQCLITDPGEEPLYGMIKSGAESAGCVGWCVV